MAGGFGGIQQSHLLQQRHHQLQDCSVQNWTLFCTHVQIGTQTDFQTETTDV
jgi:hypothetical protein